MRYKSFCEFVFRLRFGKGFWATRPEDQPPRFSAASSFVSWSTPEVPIHLPFAPAVQGFGYQPKNEEASNEQKNGGDINADCFLLFLVDRM